MAEYKVVEVTQLFAGTISDQLETESFDALVSELCPAGWEIISTRLMETNGIQRAVVLLSR